MMMKIGIAVVRKDYVYAIAVSLLRAIEFPELLVWLVWFDVEFVFTYEQICIESRNCVISGLLSAEPAIIFIIWHTCITPYVLVRAPKAIGPALVAT